MVYGEIILITAYLMEGDNNQYSPNPLRITNSQLSQVKATQTALIEIFKKDFPDLAHRHDHYTNLDAVARFCIAREFQRPKVEEQWRKWIKWYEDYRPDDISESEPIIAKVHQSGKYRYCGWDKGGCPILVIRMRYHVKGLATADENLRYLLYMIEKGVKMAKEAGTNQLSVIYDRRDMAESDDVSKESMKKFMPILNDCYPETLKAFYVLGAGFLYRAMWKIVSIFVSKRTEEKINMLEDVSGLKYFITDDNLDQEYGGTLKIEDVGRIVPLTQ